LHKNAEHQLGEGCSLRCASFAPLKLGVGHIKWRRTNMRLCARKLCRAGLILLCLVLALEVSLRIAGYYYRAQFWEETTSNKSFSDQDIIVLAIGESTTAGIWVPREDSYPKQLERLLRAHYRTDGIYVVIPPHIGQNTSQMVHNFDDYLNTFRPALVIIMAGVNNPWSLAQSNLAEFMPRYSWKTYCFRLRRWIDDIKVVRLVRVLIPEVVQS
jgi:hypothetical protein